MVGPGFHRDSVGSAGSGGRVGQGEGLSKRMLDHIPRPPKRRLRFGSYRLRSAEPLPPLCFASAFWPYLLQQITHWSGWLRKSGIGGRGYRSAVQPPCLWLDRDGVAQKGRLAQISPSRKGEGQRPGIRNGGVMRYSMRITSLLVIAYTVPAFAQQTSVADSRTRQQAEAVLMQYTDAVNNGDTAALGAVFAPNALDINPFGILKDPGTHFEETERVHKMGLILTAKVDDVEPIFGGQGAIVTAPYTSKFTDPAIPPGRGNMLLVLERAGESWKIRAISASRLLPAAPAK